MPKKTTVEKPEVPEPIEYACDGVVCIRCCPTFLKDPARDKRYWYIHRRLFAGIAVGNCTAETVVRLWQQGLRHWYWTASGWDWHTPKQYETPTAAFADYLQHIKPLADKSQMNNPRAAENEP